MMEKQETFLKGQLDSVYLGKSKEVRVFKAIVKLTGNFLDKNGGWRERRQVNKEKSERGSVC